jgi:hypothetical protein
VFVVVVDLVEVCKAVRRLLWLRERSKERQTVFWSFVCGSVSGCEYGCRTY